MNGTAIFSSENEDFALVFGEIYNQLRCPIGGFNINIDGSSFDSSFEN